MFSINRIMSRKILESILRQKPIIIITFLFFILCLFLSWKLNIWEDESYTLTTVSNDSLKSLIRASIVFEGQPPFYFIIAYFWAKISSSIIFMRVLSTLFTIASGLLLYKLYKKDSVNSNWWIIILVFANPFMIYLATEIRCYSLVVLLSVLIIGLFQKYYCNQNVPVLIRVLFITLAIAAVNTQYFVAFLLLSNGIFLLIKGFKRTLVLYLIDMVFVLISLLWVPFIIGQQIDSHVYKDLAFGLGNTFRFIFGRLDTYVLFRDYIPFKIAGYIIEILIVFTIIIHFYLKRQTKKYIGDNFYYIFQIAAVSLCFVLVYPLFGNDLLAIRHTAVLFPLIFLLFLRSLDYIHTKYIKAVLISTIFLFYMVGSSYFYKSFVKDFDVHAGMKYLKGKLKNDEPIVLIRQRVAVPFVYYLKGFNNITIFPFAPDYTSVFDRGSLAIPAKKKIVEEVFSKISKNNSFWVINFYLIDSLASDVQAVESLIGPQYTLESDTVFIDTKSSETYFPIQIRKLRHN